MYWQPRIMRWSQCAVFEGPWEHVGSTIFFAGEYQRYRFGPWQWLISGGQH